MPDPLRTTISATEAPALFNASPYVTRWMLHHKFASGLVIDGAAPNSRMDWGKKMQPLILAQVAAEKGMEVIPNADDTYVRRGLLGCTRDAVIHCPERGPGALETKCVFDYATWMDKWQGGASVPRHYEIQLQTQMYVGEGELGSITKDGDDYVLREDGRIRSYHWGLLAVWVCAELHYFERREAAGLWRRLEDEAARFFADVYDGREPDAYGATVEAPYVTTMYPTREGQVLDLSADPEHITTSELVSALKDYRDIAASHSKLAEESRVKLLALARDAEQVLLPCGVNYRIRKSGKGKTIVPYVPEQPTAPPPPKDRSVLHAG